MGNSRYPNLSWSPKPPFAEDFDGSVTAQTIDGTYAIEATANRIPGTTAMGWFGKEIFIATFQPREGDVQTLTAAPTTRIEAQKLVKAHQRRAFDKREKTNKAPPSAPTEAPEQAD